MDLLASAFAQSGDTVLEEFYRSLLASEARHKKDYLDLAHRFFDEEDVLERIQQLAQAEAAILSKPGPAPRMHS